MAEEILLGLLLVTFIETMLVLVSWKQIKLKFKYMKLKRKGAKILVYLTKHGTINYDVIVPDKNNQFKYKIGGEEQEFGISQNTMKQDLYNDAQAVIIMQGNQQTVDPVKPQESPVDPQLIESALYNAKLLGQKQAELAQKKKEKALILILVLSAAAAGFGFLNMQALGQMQGGVNAIVALVSQIPVLLP